MSTIEQVATVVNWEAPDFERGVYRPADMQRTKAANCLGRALLAYVLLREADVPDGALSLLVDTTHASQFKPNEYWRGHVMLLANIKSDGGIIDSFSTTFVRQLDEATWPPSSLAQSICLVNGDLYSVHHPVSQGLLDYQQRHPLLAEGPMITTDDYTNAYAGLATFYDQLSNC